MKKLMLLLIASLLVTGCAKPKTCDVNEGMICFDENSNQFFIEENASIVVAVANEEVGLFLRQQWDQIHPDQPGVVDFVVQDSFDGSTYLNSRPDIALLWSNEAARLEEWFIPLDKRVEEEISPTLLSQYGASINRDQFRFVPMFGYGWVFSYNRTMLEAMDLDLSDENKDNLPDSLDTFEKLAAINERMPFEYREKNVATIFDFNFDDMILPMAYFGFGNYVPFSSFEAEKPDLDSESFLQVLQALQDLGSHKWTGFDEQELTSSWNFEKYLSESFSPFSMVGTWMYYDAFEELTEQDFGFSVMPAYQQAQGSPYALSAGYLISRSSPYPNACLEVMRMIRSIEGLEAFALLSDQPLLYNYALLEGINDATEEKIFPELVFKNHNLEEISRALVYGAEESMVAFKFNPSVRGWSVFRQADVYQTMQDVFCQKITAEEAFEQVQNNVAQWMKKYMPPTEEDK